MSDSLTLAEKKSILKYLLNNHDKNSWKIELNTGKLAFELSIDKKRILTFFNSSDIGKYAFIHKKKDDVYEFEVRHEVINSFLSDPDIEIKNLTINDLRRNKWISYFSLLISVLSLIVAYYKD